MRKIFLDFETTMSSTVNIRTLGVRRFLLHPETRVLTVAWAIDDGPVRVDRPDTPGFDEFLRLIGSGEFGVVAHNASFDVRVLRYLLNMPWPPEVYCTMELAQAWTPNQPGGYSLGNLATFWCSAQYQKAKIDFATCTPDELDAYCRQDTEVCRELFWQAERRLSPSEIAIHLLTQSAKELQLRVDRDRAIEAIAAFDTTTVEEAEELVAIFGEDAEEVFGREGTRIKSVKAHVLKSLMLEELAFDTQTISLKKINPEKVRRNEIAGRVLKHAAATNKALVHRRNVSKFVHSDVVDCELTYFAAHTGRFSSRNNGKGLNLHNLPKRNPRIARPIREMFRLPEDLCFVRGDFANVEYRVAGWLTDCQHVCNLFLADINADPYIAFWSAATGQMIDKTHPARQLAKAAVLGLGFGMGIQRWMHELMIGLADPTFGVTLADLEQVCQEQRWTRVPDRRAKAAMTKLRAPLALAIVAHYTREMFHELHPEYMRFARWLETATNRLASAINIEATIDSLYATPNAPDRRKVQLVVDEELQGRSVRVICGGWDVPTVTWRDVATRSTPFGMGMTCVMGGNKGYRHLYPSIYIENVVQSTARIGLCRGMLRMRDLGYPYQLSVHDELMPVVPRKTDQIIRAKENMASVFGEGNDLGFDWAVYIKPGDITVTESLYEDEKLAKEQWPKIYAGETEVLLALA